MHCPLDVLDLPVQMPGPENVSGRRNTRRGLIQRRPGRLRYGNSNGRQRHHAAHNRRACNFPQ
jgi:hypothetical protein